MKHRKGTIARAIQDYFLSNPFKSLIDEKAEWAWFKIPNNPEFCVALEWQDGYDKFDKEFYGKFMEETYVMNVSIKLTDEFRFNGPYALYAETYYVGEDEEISGGMSLSDGDEEQEFFDVSKVLADDYIKFSRSKRVKENI